MKVSRTNTAWILSLLVVFGAASCSQQAKLNPVQGKVVLNDQPLANARVIFHPTVDAQSTDWPVAMTSSDGTFTVKTGDRVGAPEGKYNVSIVCMEAPPAPTGKKGAAMEMTMGEEVDKLKGAYADPAKSKFTVEVKPGTNELEPFKLQ